MFISKSEFYRLHSQIDNLQDRLFELERKHSRLLRHLQLQELKIVEHVVIEPLKSPEKDCT